MTTREIREETKALLERHQAELREHRDEFGYKMPTMTRADINHLLTEIGIAIKHLDPSIPDDLLKRGTIE